MTLPEVARLFAYWNEYPPLRDLVAAAIGFRPSDRTPRRLTLEEFRAMYPNGISQGG